MIFNGQKPLWFKKTQTGHMPYPTYLPVVMLPPCGNTHPLKFV